MPKIANFGFVAPKPYLKGVDPDFLFDRKLCLVKIFALKIELYCKVNNLNFQISPNKLDKIIFFIKQKG